MTPLTYEIEDNPPVSLVAKYLINSRTTEENLSHEGNMPITPASSDSLTSPSTSQPLDFNSSTYTSSSTFNSSQSLINPSPSAIASSLLHTSFSNLTSSSNLVSSLNQTSSSNLTSSLNLISPSNLTSFSNLASPLKLLSSLNPTSPSDQTSLNQTSSSNFISSSNPTSPLNLTTGNESQVTELPLEMVFNSSHVITISAYSCLWVLSALGNIYVLKSIAGHGWRNPASRVTLMILHLTIADLLVTFLLMPLEIGWAWTVSWRAGDVACRALAFFRTFGVFLSGFILVAISIDRYYAVLRPLTVMEAKRRVRHMLWGAWLASTLCSLPQAMIFHVERHPIHRHFEQCVTFHSFPSPTYELLYNLAGFVAMYALPLATIVFCYGSIVLALYRKDVSSREAGGVDGGDSRRFGVWLGRTKTRTLHMTLIIVLVFFLCWTPYNIMSLWYFIDRQSARQVDPRVQAALFIFAVANSTVNPLVYGYFNVRRGSRSANTHNNNHNYHNHNNHDWRSKRIVYKPPFRQHLQGCVCRHHTESSSSDLHPHHYHHPRPSYPYPA